MFKEEHLKLRNAVFCLTWAKIGKVPVKIGGHTREEEEEHEFIWLHNKKYTIVVIVQR